MNFDRQSQDENVTISWLKRKKNAKNVFKKNNKKKYCRSSTAAVHDKSMGGAGGYEKCLEAVVKYKKALSWFRAALSCVENF